MWFTGNGLVRTLTLKFTLKYIYNNSVNLKKNIILENSKQPKLQAKWWVKGVSHPPCHIFSPPTAYITVFSFETGFSLSSILVGSIHNPIHPIQSLTSQSPSSLFAVPLFHLFRKHLRFFPFLSFISNTLLFSYHR